MAQRLKCCSLAQAQPASPSELISCLNIVLAKGQLDICEITQACDDGKLYVGGLHGPDLGTFMRPSSVLQCVKSRDRRAMDRGEVVAWKIGGAVVLPLIVLDVPAMRTERACHSCYHLRIHTSHLIDPVSLTSYISFTCAVPTHTHHKIPPPPTTVCSSGLLVSTVAL